MKTQYAPQRLRLSLMLSLLLLVVSPSAYSKPDAKSLVTESYLFVQSASEATITVNKDNKNPGTYVITLQNISPFVTYFSDRPVRDAGIMPIEKFLKFWQDKGRDSFKADPPNAVLNALQKGIFSSEDKTLNFPVVLTKPYYDSTAKTLTYMAKTLPGSADVLSDAITLQHVTFFIDNLHFCEYCN